MKNAIVVLMFIAFPLYLAGQQPDAGQVMQQSRDLTMTGSLKATLTLSIKEKSGTMRTRTISMSSSTFPGNIEKRLIRFVDPPDVKGTSMLFVDNSDSPDEMWIYLPALKKTRRIVSSEKGRSFMSSEFSNADMTSPAIADFKNKFITEGGGSDKYVIESIPSDQEKAREYGYSKKITWMDKASLHIEKMEFYNFDNQLYKVIEVKKIQDLQDGKYMITDMLSVNRLNGRESEIKFTDISQGEKSDPSVFTVQNLER